MENIQFVQKNVIHSVIFVILDNVQDVNQIIL